MTSVGAVVADMPEPCAICPGPAGCLLTRRNPVSAYVGGCRAPEATAANTAKAAHRRASKRSQRLAVVSASAWDSPDAEPGSELTGESCGECGAPVGWAPARAGQVCAAGHFMLPPDAAERAAETRAARARTAMVPAAEEPAIADTLILDVETDRLIRACNSALAGIDTSQLRELSSRFPSFSFIPSWDENEEQDMIALLKAIISRARAIRDREILAEYRAAYMNTISSPVMNRITTLIHQAYLDAASHLNYRSQGTRYRINPDNPCRIVQTEPDNVITAIPERRAIAAPEEEYDTDEDDEYTSIPVYQGITPRQYAAIVSGKTILEIFKFVTTR